MQHRLATGRRDQRHHQVADIAVANVHRDLHEIKPSAARDDDAIAHAAVAIVRNPAPRARHEQIAELDRRRQLPPREGDRLLCIDPSMAEPRAPAAVGKTEVLEAAVVERRDRRDVPGGVAVVVGRWRARVGRRVEVLRRRASQDRCQFEGRQRRVGRQHQRGDAGHQRRRAGGAAEVVGEAARGAGGGGDAEASDAHAEIGVAVRCRRAQVDAGAVVRVVAAPCGAGERRDVHHAGDVHHVVLEVPGSARPGPLPAAGDLLPAVGVGYVQRRLVQDRAVVVAGRPQEQDAAASSPAVDRQLPDAVDHRAGEQEHRHRAPGVGQDVDLVGDVAERGQHLRVVDQQRRALRLPLDRQQPAARRRPDRQPGIGLAGDHAGTRGAMVGTGLVHAAGLGVGIAVDEQACTAEVAPAGELAG